MDGGAFAAEEGEDPALSGAAAGLRSSQTAYHHLRKLEEEGYVAREEGRAKIIWLTEKGWETAGRVSLMGRIAAGRGLEAVATDEAHSLASELLAVRVERRRYRLRVVGQTIVGARIEDGASSSGREMRPHRTGR